MTTDKLNIQHAEALTEILTSELESTIDSIYDRVAHDEETITGDANILYGHILSNETIEHALKAYIKCVEAALDNLQSYQIDEAEEEQKSLENFIANPYEEITKLRNINNETEE